MNTSTKANTASQDATVTMRLAEAEALLRARGRSVLLQNAYGPSKTAIWTGLVLRLNGGKNEASGKPMTAVSLVGGNIVWVDMPIEEAHPLLMPN